MQDGNWDGNCSKKRCYELVGSVLLDIFTTPLFDSSTSVVCGFKSVVVAFLLKNLVVRRFVMRWSLILFKAWIYFDMQYWATVLPSHLGCCPLLPSVGGVQWYACSVQTACPLYVSCNVFMQCVSASEIYVSQLNLPLRLIRFFFRTSHSSFLCYVRGTVH